MIYNIEIDNINMRDYPDFSDAFISYAEHEDGTPLTEEELDSLDIHEYIWEYVT